jgi:RluA family pseudouridine synthase
MERNKNGDMVGRDRSPATKDFFVSREFGVIYEDREILVVDKPAPLPVYPAGAYGECNLLSILEKDSRWSGVPLKTVHRLDAETSGVILLAKGKETARILSEQFSGSRVSKSYRAIVFGCPPEAKGEIRFPLGDDRSSGFQIFRVRDDANGEAAATDYEVLSSTPAYSLLALSPLTGRTHQLRIHLSLLGHPIVGDKVYPDPGLFERYVKTGLSEALMERLKLPRLALHAYSIAFSHPATNERRVFVSPLPAMMVEFALRNGLSTSPVG